MRNIIMTEMTKEVLREELGEKAINLDSELNELAKLIIKRKEMIQAFNRGNFKSVDRYKEINEEIRNLLADINKKC
jgi:hypothetical protein